MILFYVPCPDKNTAVQISRVLLEEKLVGCCHILPAMESMYHWNDRMETSTEHILLLKTLNTSDAQLRITQRVIELHPYQVPCVMTLPVLGINDSYKKWLEESLK